MYSLFWVFSVHSYAVLLSCGKISQLLNNLFQFVFLDLTIALYVYVVSIPQSSIILRTKKYFLCSKVIYFVMCTNIWFPNLLPYTRHVYIYRYKVDI